MILKLRSQKSHRKGTTTVEAAIVLPVFLFFVYALIEFGHAQLVSNVLQTACREAARYGSTNGVSTDQVYAKVNQTISTVIDPDDASLYVKDASVYDTPNIPQSGAEIEALPNINLEDADARKMFLVRAKVNYNDIALIPMPFMQGVVLESQAFMRHE